MTLVAGILLAAGGGSRFGMPKALVRHRGRLLVEHATQVLRTGGCAPVVVVLGAASEQVRSTAQLPGACVVDNPGWTSGMGSSLRVGLARLAECPASAALIVPVDTPGLTASAVRRVARLAAPDVLARATYHGAPGHPVLIGRSHWPAVAELADGDTGARPYLDRHVVIAVACEDIALGEDADRPDDLAP